MEIAIVIIHPFPFLHNISIWGDEKWGVLMFLRLYMILHVIRDFSTIYKTRRKLAQMYKSRTPPKFDWFLSIKTYHYQYPIWSMLSLTIFVMFLFGYIVYIFEREVSGTNITFWVAVYLSFAGMVAGWPADPFGEYNPVTIVGKSLCTVSLFMGLLLLAGLLELIMSKLTPTVHDRPAIAWVAHYNMKKKQKEAAARLIQLVFRRHRDKAHKNTTIHELQYFRQYIQLVQKLQLIRRDITLKEMQIEEIEDSGPQIFEMHSARKKSGDEISSKPSDEISSKPSDEISASEPRSENSNNGIISNTSGENSSNTNVGENSQAEIVNAGVNS
eukprot:Phypoly_transcript_13575.p1 GENE.Phypoly_transcript_13575~~Phypoly_transcript_13575.p1  ORF type:complete len:345 (+),score=50.15 Phypoly_transcript_13575:50-1036(+)